MEMNNHNKLASYLVIMNERACGKTAKQFAYAETMCALYNENVQQVRINRKETKWK